MCEARAKAIANFVLDRGMMKQLLPVRWYGMRHPKDSNDAEIVRAKSGRHVTKVTK